MFLALKRFNQGAIYLHLASGPDHTSFTCVLEDAGKINATILQRPWRGRQPVKTGFVISGVLLIKRPWHIASAGGAGGRMLRRIGKS